MIATQTFYHNDTRYQKYNKVELKDKKELNELAAKGLIADKAKKPAAKTADK